MLRNHFRNNTAFPTHLNYRPLMEALQQKIKSTFWDNCYLDPKKWQNIQLFINLMFFLLVNLFHLIKCWIVGAMYYPMVWHATSECTPDMSPHDCKFTLKVPDPPGGETCTHNSTTNGCSRQGSHTAWFTNFTSVPEVTLQASIYQK